MKKTISFSLIYFLLVWPSLLVAQSQTITASFPIVSGGVISGCSGPATDTGNSGCLYRETFEGSTLCYSGFSSNCNYAWNYAASASEIFNDTTAPAPLQGSYSLYEPDAAAVDSGKVFFAYTAASTAYVGVAFNLSGYPASTNIGVIELDATVDTDVCIGGFYGNSLLQVKNLGGTTQTTAVSMTAGTTYYMLVQATVGTGTNATCTVWLSTNGGASWTNTISSTNGTWTANTGYVHFSSPTGTGVNVANLVADDMRISSSTFTY